MKYVESVLSSDESIVYQTRLHWVVMFASVIAASVFGVTGVGLLGNHGLLHRVAVVLIVATIVLATIASSRRAATEIAVTDKRVLVKTGWVNQQLREFKFPDIRKVLVEQDFLGRALGFGTLVMHVAGGTIEQLNKVENPQELQRQVVEQIGKAQKNGEET